VSSHTCCMTIHGARPAACLDMPTKSLAVADEVIE
jgi:hypothetical protein